MRLRHWFGTVAMISVGCGGSTGQAGRCDEGEDATIGSHHVCVYESPIIEDGFRCPDDTPFRYAVDDFVICAATELDEDAINAWLAGL
ncbi:MAG: hypothetical protein KDA28_06360, partial [Phycisphaerales bacterium]|nr:hypothetical protein [Phycisphaerales bacterium]